MSLKKLSVVELTAWSAKLESHIEDLQKMVRIYAAIKKANKLYDNDSRRYNVINGKLTEVSAKLNEIYTLIDAKSVEQIGLDFDIVKLSELSSEIDGDYLKQQRLLEEKAQKALKDVVKKDPTKGPKKVE